MQARCLMVQGTASHVGKSIITAGFCRLFARRGYRVAPFKSQNMALNSFVTADGREIGRSQAFQAEAAGVAPRADMNPVLLKPCSEQGAQVIVMGRPVAPMDVRQYHGYQSIALEAAAAALDHLRGQFDLVIIEGAGSPAEVNLRGRDIANMQTAALADASVLLVGDIDRGGVFASLYGTMALLLPDERARVKGLLINRFRGDPSMLESGLQFLQEEWGAPVLGVLPYLPDLQVDEEDSVALDRRSTAVGAVMSGPHPADVVVVRLPYISNFTDFDALASTPGIRLRYVDCRSEWGTPDLALLPGTRSTIHDLQWLRSSGLARAIVDHTASGGRVIGICGGYQMLGRHIHDPAGVESTALSAEGLGLLDVETSFGESKELSQVQGTGLGSWLSEIPVNGYEIHQGRTVRSSGCRPFIHISRRGDSDASVLDGAVSPSGNVMGTYLHGLFDSAPVRQALALWLEPATAGERSAEVVDDQARRAVLFDRLANWLESNLDMPLLCALAGI